MVHFATLGSSSKGNAAWIECSGEAILLDCGLKADVLVDRLRMIGRTWQPVRGVILSHVHGDHWNDSCFGELLVRRIPLWLHRRHVPELRLRSPAFQLLEKNELLGFYSENRWFLIGRSFRCLPVEVAHDSEPTFAFRVEAGTPPATLALGYASDLGCGNPQLLAALTDVHLLALEFNHDPELQRRSRRPWHLIRRVLSDKGHLSNQQAAAFLEEVVHRSERPPRYLVQLHLSEECNRPEMAAEAVLPIVQRYNLSLQVVTAPRNEPTPVLSLTPAG